MVYKPNVQQNYSYMEVVTTDEVAMNVEVGEPDAHDHHSSTMRNDSRVEMEMSKVLDSDLSPIKSPLQSHSPSDSCIGHSDLLLLQDEKLVKPGDKFESLVHFVQYLNENAKRWCYYYKCSDSRKPRVGNESYTYNCVYLKNKDKYIKKGLRKRNNNTKTDCPCKIKVRHLPNEKELTVVYVCNHHDHDLTQEGFHKLQHGRRLPPYLKEEIMDFIALQVDLRKIKKYVQMVTGFTMRKPFFYTILRRMKNNNLKRHITDKRLKELQAKLSVVDTMSLSSDNSLMDDHDLDSINDTMYNSGEVSPQHGEGKVMKLKRRSKTSNEIEVDSKRTKMKDILIKEEDIESENNLQKSIKCETQTNPWMSDQCVPVLANGDLPVEVDESLNKIVQYQIIQNPNDASGDSDNVYYAIQYCDDENNFTVYEKVDDNGEYVLNEESGQLEQDVSNEDNVEYKYILNEQSGQIEENINYVSNDENMSIKQENNFILNEQSGEIEQCNVKAGGQKYLIKNETSYILNEQSGQLENLLENDANYILTYQYDREGETVEGNHIVEQSDSSIYNVHTENGYSDIQTEIQYIDHESQAEINETELDYSSINNDSASNSDMNSTRLSNQNENAIMKNFQNVSGEKLRTDSEKVDSRRPIVPVFDVYMKGGNVTGFVVKDQKNINGADKQIQTDDKKDVHASISHTTEDNPENIEIKSKEDCILRISGDTYTKDEYIHKYNIDRYMTQPNFPKYVQTLSKETFIDVLSMFTNIYKEKGMFKMTTTQKGRQGNTTIWYILDKHRVRRIARRSDDQSHLNQNLEEMLKQKEKVKSLKKRNNELSARNKFLEELVSKLVNDNNCHLQLQLKTE